MQFLRIMALLAILLTAGCATSSSAPDSTVRDAHPRVIAARVNNAGWSSRETKQATSLYALKCGRCHKFYDPAAYDQEDWDDWFRKMSRKSKLTAGQDKTLSAYLQAAR